ncbi:MAG TPA: thioredoxin family protein [Flavisolibacter sp.]
MKQLTILAIALACTMAAAAQQEISRDASGNKIIKGFISKEELATDTAFAWFLQNQQQFTPDAGAVKAFSDNRDSINIIAFAGTWCGDTKSLLPKFFVLADAAGFPLDRITILGVDRSKKTIQHLSEAFGVTNVPTFIVMKNGREIGRVVEYGRYGMVDKELGEIINAARK